ncbi:MAG: hypothetical protein IT373_36555 [Polyangiaceae bacterium]|nr:hypothetical protein [Polyangiaceae bacterium]
MTFDMRLVKKGRSEPLAGLTEQARYHIGLAKQHAAVLEENGWAPADTAALEVGVDAIDTKAAAKGEAADLKLRASEREGTSIDDAKAFVRRLRNALPKALRAGAPEGVTAASFEAGATLGRSTPKLSDYLNRIRPSVVKLDEALKRSFKQALASTQLDAVKQALDAADARQEVAVATLPDETKKVYEAKGRVLELIEDLNRDAKIAFDGDADSIALFNKDILLRARRVRKKTEPTA